jgi:hypothetical protein
MLRTVEDEESARIIKPPSGKKGKTQDD